MLYSNIWNHAWHRVALNSWGEKNRLGGEAVYRERERQTDRQTEKKPGGRVGEREGKGEGNCNPSGRVWMSSDR